jgi:O-methyltransferase
MFDLSMLQTQQMPWVQALKSITPPILWRFAYRQLVVRDIDGADRYEPQYCPWLEPEFKIRYEEIKSYTLVGIDRCWYLTTIARQALALDDGAFLEAGAYRGGTALLLRKLIEGSREKRKFYVLDSFSGMQTVDRIKDRHKVGDLSDTSLEAVRSIVGDLDFIEYRKGWIPSTFAGLEAERFSFAHIDVDLYKSVLDCCEFIYPRLCPGGVLIFDDYGFPNNPGARRAVDEYFKGRNEQPIVLTTGQALVWKLPKHVDT